MRLSGTLKKWNDDRGFGFIAQSDGGADIFVHVSQFSLGGSRPAVGEKLSYVLGHSPDGKPQAIKVVRLDGGADRSSRTTDAGNTKTRFSIVEACALAIIVAIVGVFGYKHFSAPQERQVVAEVPAADASAATTPVEVVPVEVAPVVVAPPVIAPAATAPKPAAASFRCDGRTHCSQMTSCAEATWFINNCPDTKMDGNHDGIPCERQWCTGAFAK